MGQISKGSQLSWRELKSHAGHIRKHGLMQFLAQYRKLQAKAKNGFTFKWGDETEYMIVRFDHSGRKVFASLRSMAILSAVNERARQNTNEPPPTLWQMEYASYSIEGIPGEPYGGTLADFLSVQENMELRRMQVEEVLNLDEALLSMTVFPRLGCGDYTWPPVGKDPQSDVTGSTSFPDVVVCPGNPRYRSLTRNVPERRRKKVAINVPVFQDVNISWPFQEDLSSKDEQTSTDVLIDQIHGNDQKSPIVLPRQIHGDDQKVNNALSGRFNGDNQRFTDALPGHINGEVQKATNTLLGHINGEVQKATNTLLGHINGEVQKATNTLPGHINGDVRKATNTLPGHINGDVRKATNTLPGHINGDNQQATDAIPGHINGDVQKPPNTLPGHINEDNQQVTVALPGHIHGDAMGLGLGVCCLQVTFQACNLEEAKILHDQLAPLGPIMLALTAASPVFKGYLADVDCRWPAVSQSIDDRTDEEKGLKPLKNERFRIARARFGSVESYVTAQAQLCNDVNFVYDQAVYDELLREGLDDGFAKHIAHLFIREPLFFDRERLHVNDEENADDYDSIQLSNWQTVRFKLPPPKSDIGWRVEFRPMEVQLTELENAAFVVFMALMTRVILTYKLNFVIPISKVDKNMQISCKRDAVLNEKFYIRKDAFPKKNTRDDMCCEFMTMDEIFNGKDEFPGLIPLARSYLDDMEGDVETHHRVSDYLKLISLRASGKLSTCAHWIRQFVVTHPDYKHDSVVSDSIAYDLLKRISDISSFRVHEPSLLFMPSTKEQFPSVVRMA